MPSQRPRLTREAIVTEARAEVTRDGLANLSLRRLAAGLGVTAPALYLHFDGKQALLAAIAEGEFTRLLADLEAAAATTTGGAVDKIKAQSHAYVNYAVANPAFFEIMFAFRPGRSPGLGREDFPLATKVFRAGTTPVEQAITAGVLHATDAITAALTIWAAVHGVTTLLLAGPRLGKDFEAKLVRTVIDTIIAGFMHPADI